MTYTDNLGSKAEKYENVKAHGRLTVNVNTVNINGVQAMNYKNGVSMKVESVGGGEVIAERAMYWEVAGVKGAEGHCSVGHAN